MTIRIRPINFLMNANDDADGSGMAALITPSLINTPSDDAPEAMASAKPGTGWMRWTNTQRALVPGLD